MSRRNQSLFDDLIDITAKLPWWGGIVLAVVAYLVLHPITFALFTAIAAFSAAAQPFLAQDAAGSYPAKPIRIIVPFPPGAGTDIIGRAIGQSLSEAWKHAVVIDNREKWGKVVKVSGAKPE